VSKKQKGKPGVSSESVAKYRNIGEGVSMACVKRNSVWRRRRGEMIENIGEAISENGNARKHMSIEARNENTGASCDIRRPSEKYRI
jgi:hypothetical protein